MFKDYYAILEVNYPSDEKEIKSAYRKETLKWHPDKNIGRNTEEQMKDINEAYTILSNLKSRERYEREYQIFKQNQKKKEGEFASGSAYSKNNRHYHRNEESCNTKWQYDYDVKDSSLKDDIKNARESAEKYVKDFLESLRNDSKVAAGGTLDEIFPYLLVGIMMAIITFIVQTCS